MSFAHLTLATRDVVRTRDFFAATLGWTPIDRPGNIIDRDAAWLEMSSGQQLHILEVPAFEPSAFEQEFGRHVAIFRPREEFPALKQRLLDNGAELIDPARETPFERFFFREFNGYVFEVVDESQREDR